MSDGITIAIITASGALLLGLINLLMTTLTTRRRRQEEQYSKIIVRLDQIDGQLVNESKGVQALLRFKLHDLNKTCQRKGYATEFDKTNFIYLYDKYHNLGSNGVMDHIKESFLDLPLSKKIKSKGMTD